MDASPNRIIVHVCVVFPPHTSLFLPPFIIFDFPFLLPPTRNSDPGSYSRLFSPLPSTVRALHCYGEKTSTLSSLVDSRRIAPTHARRSRQMILRPHFF